GRNKKSATSCTPPAITGRRWSCYGNCRTNRASNFRFWIVDFRLGMLRDRHPRPGVSRRETTDDSHSRRRRPPNRKSQIENQKSKYPPRGGLDGEDRRGPENFAR